MKFKNTLFLLLIFSSTCILSSQQYNDDLGSDFHKKKRQEFRNQMPANSIAFFFTSPIMKRSNDTDFMYHQDPNYYYLTGWREPHGVLVIFKDNQQDDNGFYNEILFVRERNEYREMWDGKRLGLKGAKNMNFDRVLLRSDFIENSIKIEDFSNVLNMNIRDDVRDFKDDKYISSSYQDYTKWEMVDRVGNIFNRLIMYRADNYHVSLDYFGKDISDGRLFQVFFFNTER
jgi:Xaa-Pro aminopeptidase